ncbi:MAG: hypothetical protein GX370_01535 [Clostridia bacterium]|jgi:hypothetical protein|nr:hypothetical protein [Clostridia bacterium]
MMDKKYQELLKEYYKKDNFKIEYSNKDSNVCAIYFSSNGLYPENTEEAFRREVVNKDKYEWYKTRIEYAGKHIFLRDIQKHWYLDGINDNYSSIEKLLDFLKKETEGYEIITMGNSSGGYMAVLMGIILNAKLIFNFSGQFSLEYHTEKDKSYFNQYLYENKDNYDKNKYYNLVELVESSSIPIVYFYPAMVEEDLYQRDCVKNCKNLLFFKFASSVHGRTAIEFNIKKILNKSLEELKELEKLYDGQAISRISFSIRVSGYVGTVKGILQLSMKRFIKKIF